MQHAPSRLLAVVLVTSCAACGDADPANDADTTDDVGDVGDIDVSDTDIADTTPEIFEPPVLTFGPCTDPYQDDPRIECARLPAPLDHRAPTSADPRVTLHVTRAKASEPDNRIGVLFVNPGGPGADSHKLVLQFAKSQYVSYFARYFDIVGVDWRGTGASTPTLSTMDSSDVEMLRFLTQTSDDPTRDYMAFWRKVMADLRADVGDAQLARLDTETAARDMDYVRKALDEDAINFFGTSYGTKLGATYATLFPERVRAFVLDAPIEPTGELLATLLAQMEGYEAALRRFFANCARGVGCPLANNSTNPAVIEEAWFRVLDELDNEPLVLTDGRTLTGGEFVNAAHAAIGDPYLWFTYKEALGDLVAGDPSYIMDLADYAAGLKLDGTYGTSGEKNFAIWCADSMGPSRPSREDFLAALADAREQWPTFAIGRLYEACYDWEHENRRVVIDAKDAPPLFVVAGNKDAATPIDGGRAMHEALGNASFFLESDHEGHVALMLDSIFDPERETATRRMRDFLVDPSRMPDEFSCDALPRGQHAIADAINISVKFAPPMPAPPAGHTATIELRDRTSDEVVASKVVPFGAGTATHAITIETQGKAQDVYVRITAENYAPFEYHRRRVFDRSQSTPELRLWTPAELTRIYGNRYDANATILQVRGENCDGDGIEDGTFTITPLVGETLYTRRSAQGDCPLATANTSSDAACSMALIFKVPEGIYDITHRAPNGSGLSVRSIEIRPATWTWLDIRSP